MANAYRFLCEACYYVSMLRTQQNARDAGWVVLERPSRRRTMQPALCNRCAPREMARRAWVQIGLSRNGTKAKVKRKGA
jgi:hypothetical protein